MNREYHVIAIFGFVSLALLGIGFFWPTLKQPPSLMPQVITLTSNFTEPAFTKDYNVVRSALAQRDLDTRGYPETWRLLENFRFLTDELNQARGKSLDHMNDLGFQRQQTGNSLLLACEREDALWRAAQQPPLQLYWSLAASAMTVVCGFIAFRVAAKERFWTQLIATRVPDLFGVGLHQQIEHLVGQFQKLTDEVHAKRRETHQKEGELKFLTEQFECRQAALHQEIQRLEQLIKNPPDGGGGSHKSTSPQFHVVPKGSTDRLQSVDPTFLFTPDLKDLFQIGGDMVQIEIEDTNLLWLTYDSDEPVKFVFTKIAAVLCQLGFAEMRDFCYSDEKLFWAKQSSGSLAEIEANATLKYRSEPLDFRGGNLAHQNLQFTMLPPRKMSVA